ncbi:response regulator transcription factor [Patiriisocius marinus]|uniref:DNA-binding response regulator n=1 Tax=Patiriisocius marinus TaxID=1397112 RepID=A0A5J4IMJ3_9FLAO|nr:response regulator transcription factor [Patiriisocius marinus]GER58465.1 DNA-binding response regulator [Patiriisocius marinus]
MNKITLLIVDDHKMFLDGLIAILSKEEDIEIIGTANNGVSALNLLSKHIPDLIITDISMPEMNGIEFIKKAKEIYPQVKILAVSMFDRIQSFNNIDGYLLKETGYDELLIAIKNIVLKNEKYFKKVNPENETDFEFNKTILTKREKEIVVLIANELTTDEIATKLFLSKHTVETHKKNIFLKLKVNNAAGLIKKAIYLGYM